MKSNTKEIYFIRPGVDLIKIGCTAQIIVIALPICAPHLRPTFEKLFTGVSKCLAQDAKDRRKGKQFMKFMKLTPDWKFCFAAKKCNATICCSQSHLDSVWKYSFNDRVKQVILQFFSLFKVKRDRGTCGTFKAYILTYLQVLHS